MLLIGWRLHAPMGTNLVGAWRSLVARFHGVEEVARSNRVAPTSFNLLSNMWRRFGRASSEERPTLRDRTTRFWPGIYFTAIVKQFRWRLPAGPVAKLVRIVE